MVSDPAAAARFSLGCGANQRHIRQQSAERNKCFARDKCFAKHQYLFAQYFFPKLGPNSSTSTANPSGSQTTTTTQSTTTTSTTTSTAKTKLEGCLSGSGGSYTLTDKNGQTWQLSGDTSSLSEYVGKEVRVSGAEQAAGSSSNSGMSSSSGSQSGS